MESELIDFMHDNRVKKCYSELKSPNPEFFRKQDQILKVLTQKSFENNKFMSFMKRIEETPLNNRQEKLKRHGATRIRNSPTEKKNLDCESSYENIKKIKTRINSVVNTGKISPQGINFNSSLGSAINKSFSSKSKKWKKSIDSRLIPSKTKSSRLKFSIKNSPIAFKLSHNNSSEKDPLISSKNGIIIQPSVPDINKLKKKVLKLEHGYIKNLSIIEEIHEKLAKLATLSP